MKRALVTVVLSGTLIAACTKNDAPTPLIVLEAGAPKARNDADAAADLAKNVAAPDAGVLSSSTRAQALKDLNEGRKLSKAKNWTGALEAFDRALKVTPDDARVLSEVGWAAFQANDLKRAEKANTRALANTKEPLVRAPIFYNVGRVAEAKGDKPAAKKAYKESLALRDNADVKKRLADLGVETGGDDPREFELCIQPMADLSMFCKCLKGAQDDEIMIPKDEPRSCGLEGTSALGDGRLTSVLAGAETLGEKVHFLTVREGGKLRNLAELGRDYEPGAFGVHNVAVVRGGDRKTVAGHTVAVVRSEQDDNDLNMAGLELCFYRAKLETVCVVSDTAGESKCAPSIPVEITTGCGPGVDIDPKDLDDATRAAMAEIKKTAKTQKGKLTWNLADDGTLTVNVAEGSRDLFPKPVLESKRLWK